jgi:protein phosphatase 1L
VFILIVSFQLIQVMANQEAVDIARKTKDPQKAAKQLAAEALKRDSKDDISIVVVRFKG